MLPTLYEPSLYIPRTKQSITPPNAETWGHPIGLYSDQYIIQHTYTVSLCIFYIQTPSNMDLFGLIGRTALVTGGTRGIGQQMTIALAEAGADIVLVQVYYP